MAAPAHVILSPHPDDAVLSLWHLLTGPEDVAVVNVFGRCPRRWRGDTWWDRLTGARDPHERLRERHAEDRAALGLAGRRPLNLGFADGQYRESPPPVETIARRIERVFGRASGGCPRLLAPATLHAHRDHRLACDAALALRRRGWEVTLYADVPHAIAFGWPAWVTGEAPVAHLDPGAYWDDRLREAGLDPAAVSATVHRLEDRDLEDKRRAVCAYRTQLPALEAQFGPFSRNRDLAFEVSWSL